MKSLPLVVLMTGLALAAQAQTLPSADVDTVRSSIGEETLAPTAVKAQPKAAVVSATGVVSDTASAAPAAAAPAAADPFLVKGVVVTLSGTTGFDRDAALEQGARQALPGVLVSTGMDAAKAAKTVKGLGSAMKFVQSYKVVKETLIPVYTLTTDLTFNGPMILKNFGGKVPVVQGVVIKTAGTENLPVSEVEVAVPAAANMPVKQWVVRIVERDPAAVDRVRQNLNKQAGTKANYRLLTSAGAELQVETPLSAGEISQYAGHAVSVVELEIPLPTPVAGQGGAAAHPWQGQEEPEVPSSPSAPSAPAEPGSY